MLQRLASTAFGVAMLLTASVPKPTSCDGAAELRVAGAKHLAHEASPIREMIS